MNERRENSGNGWSEWQRFVLQELKRLAQCHESTEKKIEKINAEVGKIYTQIGMLKVKSGIWGALGGLIPVVLALGYIILK